MTKALTELLSDLKAITDVEINRAISMFTPVKEGERVLAAIEDVQARRLWALGLEYKRRSLLAEHASRFDARDKTERENLEGQAQRWDSMVEIVRDLAFHEMRDQTGAPAWSADTVGLREGFTLVCTKPAEEVSFGIPIPRAVVESLRKMMAGPDREEAPEPKKKPS